MKQRTKLSIVGAGIAALLVLPMAISVARSMISLRNRPPVPEQNPLTISDRSLWQEYVNEEVGFSTKYPPEMYPLDSPYEGFVTTFTFVELKELIELGLPNEVTPRIQVYAKEISVEELLDEINENRNTEQFPEFSKIVIGEYTAYQTKALDPEVIFSHTIIGNEEKAFLVEMFTVEKENDALKSAYDQMLADFKIL